MKREDLRKVEVKVDSETTLYGYFHQWAELKSDLGSTPYIKAIIEDKDGYIRLFSMRFIRFID